MHISSTLCVSIDELCVPGKEDILAQHYGANLTASLAALSEELAVSGTNFVVGSAFSIADIYLYAVLTKMNTSNINVQTAEYPNLQAYYDRMAGRADVKAAVLRMNTTPAETFPPTQPSTCACTWCA